MSEKSGDGDWGGCVCICLNWVIAVILLVFVYFFEVTLGNYADNRFTRIENELKLKPPPPAFDGAQARFLSKHKTPDWVTNPERLPPTPAAAPAPPAGGRSPGRPSS